MADITISNLNNITPSTGLFIPATNGSTTGKVTLSQVCGVMTSAQITTALGYTPVASNSPSIAKVWVSFNGTRNATNTGSSTNGANVLFRSSYNVSSVLKNGVGDYTININPGVLSDDNYCAVATCDHQSVNTRKAGFTNSRTATSLRVTIEDTSFGSGRQDSPFIGVVVFA